MQYAENRPFYWFRIFNEQQVKNYFVVAKSSNHKIFYVELHEFIDTVRKMLLEHGIFLINNNNFYTTETRIQKTSELLLQEPHNIW